MSKKSPIFSNQKQKTLTPLARKNSRQFSHFFLCLFVCLSVSFISPTERLKRTEQNISRHIRKKKKAFIETLSALASYCQKQSLLYFTFCFLHFPFCFPSLSLSFYAPQLKPFKLSILLFQGSNTNTQTHVFFFSSYLSLILSLSLFLTLSLSLKHYLSLFLIFFQVCKYFSFLSLLQSLPCLPLSSIS